MLTSGVFECSYDIEEVAIFKPGVYRPKPVRAWFLRIASYCECLYACMCVCVSAPEAIIN